MYYCIELSLVWAMGIYINLRLIIFWCETYSITAFTPSSLVWLLEFDFEDNAIAIFKETSDNISKIHEQLINYSERLSSISNQEKYDGLRWLEVSSRSIRFYTTPLDVASTLNKFFSCSNQAWIFTSATLAVGEDFSHFTSIHNISWASATCKLEFPLEMWKKCIIFLFYL